MRGASPPEFRSALAWGGCHRLNLSPAGALPSPGHLSASLTPWPGSKITLREDVPRVRAAGTAVREKLFVQRAGGGSLGRGAQETCLRCRALASSQLVEGGARSPGCGEHVDPLSEKAVGRLVSRGGTPDQEPEGTPGPFWETIAQQEARTSKEGICKSVWGRTFPDGLARVCGHLPGLSATGRGRPRAP